MIDLPDAPYDIEYFFDPSCPFAWQTSVWMRRVVELRRVRVGWRFISLQFVNEHEPDRPAEMVTAQSVALAFHRVCAAARQRFGNDAVGDLYREWGTRYWYTPAPGTMLDRVRAAATRIDPADVVAAAGLPPGLLETADDDSFDGLIRAETEEALRRVGPDVGTPIITYLPGGNSLFGPVISNVPDDAGAVRLYEALRTLAEFDAFSELKRSERPPLDLPLFEDA